MKAEGIDPISPVFSSKAVQDLTKHAVAPPSKDVCMTSIGVSQKITLEELRSQDRGKPWVRDFQLLLTAWIE